MKTTMTQGSPMALFRMNGTKTASLLRLRDTLPSAVVGYNGDTPANSTMLVLRVYDNHDDVSKYSNYDYYALYVPKGTTWNPTLGETNIGEISMTFPSENKAYFTLHGYVKAQEQMIQKLKRLLKFMNLMHLTTQKIQGLIMTITEVQER